MTIPTSPSIAATTQFFPGFSRRKTYLSPPGSSAEFLYTTFRRTLRASCATIFALDRIEVSECRGSDFLRAYYDEAFVPEEGDPYENSEGDAGACVFDPEMPTS